MISAAISLIPLAIWAYLLFGRGSFWLCGERDDTAAKPTVANKCRNAPDAWPSVVAIIPARDEADMIARSVGSLLRQDYPGPFSVVVVDDQSTDGTAAAASNAASEVHAADRLKIVTGNGPPPGWTGKLSAMRQGLAEVEASAEAPEFVLFTDADIAYAPHVLTRLAAIARAKNSVLTSLMVKLRCDSAAERWLAPAFVFFFQMLYPFAWVNDPRRTTAAAAGGCMLVRREALHAAGGLEAVRNALIDDCALGALMKGQGPIWLGLTESVDSLRAYSTFAEFRRMVSRSAFAELRYSPLRLAGAIGGMALVYVAPLLFAIFARGAAQAAGALTWAMMAIALAPMLRLYGRPLSAALRSPPSQRPMSLSRSIPHTNTGAGAAATGKDDSKRRCERQSAHDDGEGGPLRQGPQGRKFSRRLMALERAATGSDHGLLSLRARGR